MDVQHETLPDDPWREYYKAPSWFAGLIAKGALGLKTKGGIYRKVGKDVQVLDPASRDYRPSAAKLSDEVTEIFQISSPVKRFARLRASKDKHAEFLWAATRDIFHYCAYHLADIADNARDAAASCVGHGARECLSGRRCLFARRGRANCFPTASSARSSIRGKPCARTIACVCGGATPPEARCE
jgi:hypothetical protein